MKKLFAVLMAATWCFLSSAVASETASMNDFLLDVKLGIQDRIAYSDDHPTDSAEQRDALVQLELGYVAQYEGMDFGNKKFNELVKNYIAGCRMQESAATFYDRSYRVYQELWAAGLKARSVTLVEFYEDYGLDLTREDMDAYYDNLGSNNNVQIEFSGIGKTPSKTPDPTPKPTPTATPTHAPTATALPVAQAVTSKTSNELQALLELLGSIACSGLQDYDATYWTSNSGVYITVTLPERTETMQHIAWSDDRGYQSVKKSLAELSAVGWDILSESGFQNTAVYYIEIVDLDGVMWLEYLNGELTYDKRK